MMMTELIVTRTLRAPRQRVWDAFVQPELRRQWWFPEEGMTSDVCEIDARPGGAYRVNMKANKADKDGQTQEWITSGTFEELDEPRRMVFTWRWDHEPESMSRVTVELTEVAEGTDVKIIHEQLRDESDRAGHEQGWVGCLASLDRMLG